VPYCPECHDEFQDWVKVCPDCNVALVEKLPPLPKREKLPPPPKRKKQDEPLVRIAIAPNEMIANMWSGILKEHGINCLLKSDDFRAAMYSLPYNQQCEIHVLASRVEKAKEIIAPFLDEKGGRPEGV
jgi:hypothetical protein